LSATEEKAGSGSVSQWYGPYGSADSDPQMSRSTTLRCRIGNFWQLKVHHRCQLTPVANGKIFWKVLNI